MRTARRPTAFRVRPARRPRPAGPRGARLPRRATFGLLAAGLVLALAASLVRPTKIHAGAVGESTSSLHATHLGPAPQVGLWIEIFQHPRGYLLGLDPTTVPPDGTGHVWMPLQDLLRNGRYSGIGVTERETAWLLRRYWPAGRGQSLETEAAMAREIVLPRLVRRAEGQSSFLDVQSALEDRTAAVSVRAFASGADRPSASATLAITGGTALRLDLRDPAVLPELPEGFEGWLELRADEPIALSASLEGPSVQAVSSLTGLPADQAATALHAPLLLRGWAAAGLDSRLRVLNPGGAAVTLRLELEGLAGACQGRRYEQGPVVIPPRGLAWLDQGPAGDAGPAPSPLPAGCAAAGRLLADGPVLGLAELRDARPGRERAASYRLLRPEDGGRKVALPLVLRIGTADAWADRPGESAIHVSNPGPDEANVRLRLWEQDELACPGPCAWRLAPGASLRLDASVLPEPFAGSALLEADAPVLAARLDGQRGWDLAAYTGLPARDLPQPLIEKRLPVLTKGVLTSPIYLPLAGRP